MSVIRRQIIFVCVKSDVGIAQFTGVRTAATHPPTEAAVFAVVDILIFHPRLGDAVSRQVAYGCHHRVCAPTSVGDA